jgi:hypothetical protein
MLITAVIFLITPKEGRTNLLELGLAVILAFVSDIVSLVGIFVFHVNMNLSQNLLDLFTLPLFLLLYKRKISWKNTGIIVYVSIGAFLAFAILNLSFIQQPPSLASYNKTVIAISMIVASLVYFYVLIRDLPTQTITRLPMFWVNAAILIYYSGTFFVYLATDYLVNVVKSDLVSPWMIHNFLGLIFYSLITVGLLTNRSLYIVKTAG